MLYTEYEAGKIFVMASAIRPSHPADFKVDWPLAQNEYGFVQFHNAVMLQDCQGYFARPPGTCIAYVPRQSRYYHAIEETVVHSWILADGPGIATCLDTYQIPSNTAFEIGEMDFFEAYINEVRRERLQLQSHYEDAITDLSHNFFRRFGALLQERAEPGSDSLRQRVKLLNEIRLRVHADITRRWTVREMAEIESLNPTLFAMEYTRQFGVSPVDDLIDARLRRAEYLLKHVSLTTKQIAAECGFASPEHFHRLFRARRGYSPGQYRRS